MTFKNDNTELTALCAALDAVIGPNAAAPTLVEKASHAARGAINRRLNCEAEQRAAAESAK